MKMPEVAGQKVWVVWDESDEPNRNPKLDLIGIFASRDLAYEYFEEARKGRPHTTHLSIEYVRDVDHSKGTEEV